jgi:phosphatidylglycerophosphatase A
MNKPRHLVRTVLGDPVHWFAFGFGAGLLPRAPGTWGSLITALLYWWVAPVSLVWLLGVIAVLLIGGIWVCGESARRLGVHDHGGIVLDEVVGMLITVIVVPPEPIWILAAFIAFRVADIWKPWPIRDLDHRLGGGLGIMLDDVLAAVYAAFSMLLLQRFLM